MIICHMTSAHSQEDIRIFHKECVSLARAGHEVYQVSCGISRESKGVHLVGIGEQEQNRSKRMTEIAKRVYMAAREIDADVYHFHDPELLPYGLKLNRAGKKAIFDSHEDIPAQIMDKHWIPKPLRKIISNTYKSYETHVVKRLEAVVAATPHIAESFRGRCKNVVVVNNPRLDDIMFHERPFSEREAVVCYAGGIDELRGERIMCAAMEGVNGKLCLAGDHAPGEAQGNVIYLGRLDRNGINELYGGAIAGLCILKPIENYYFSKPIKIYEYMAAGLPYVCSNFPGWRKVAQESGAGICVDPENISQIREAIQLLLRNREAAQAMGRKGREYVLKYCNWENEEKSLLALYSSLEA